MFCFCLSLGAEILREVPVLDNVNRQYWWRSSLCLDVNNSGPNRPSGVLYPVELVDNFRVVDGVWVGLKKSIQEVADSLCSLLRSGETQGGEENSPELGSHQTTTGSSVRLPEGEEQFVKLREII